MSPERASTRRRVVIVARCAAFGEGVGGLERAVSDQIWALQKMGWEVVLIAPPSRITGACPVPVIGVPWPHRMLSSGRPAFGLAYWLWARRAARTVDLAVQRGDALYLHGGAAGVLRYSKKARQNAHAIVANPHGMEEFRRSGLFRLTNRVFIRRLTRGAQLAHATIATDEALVNDVARNLRVSPTRIRVVLNGVDTERLEELANLGAAEAAGAVDIVSVGRLVPNKGYDLLLQALQSVTSETESSTITWRHFGKGEMAQRLLSDAAASPGVCLEIVGGATDTRVQAEIRNARMFVQPSRYEGSSLTTLEAMTQGTVVVGTPVGGIPEKIRDGITGYLAESVSPQGLAGAIKRAMSTPSDVPKAAQEVARGRYSITATAEALSELLVNPNPKSPRRHIVQVARHIRPGSGVAQVVFSLERAFESLGVSTSRITLATTGLKLATPISRNPLAKLALLAEVVWFSIAGSIAIHRIATQDRGSAIIVHGDPIGGDIYVNHGLLKAVIHQRRGSRRIYLPMNPMHWLTLARDELRYRTTRQASIVCLTKSGVDELRHLYPTVRSPLYVIPNGVDLNSYRLSSSSCRDEVRANSCISESDRVLLFVGHEYDRKGLFLVFESLLELPENIKLLVVGGTAEMISDAVTRAVHLRVDDRVHFIGQVDDPRRYFEASDVFVLPSSYEAAQLVLLEALAMGVPAVVTPVGSARDLIHDGSNGVIIQRTSRDIARGVGEILSGLDSGVDFATICRNSVQQYDWHTIASKYLALLDRLEREA